MKEGENMNNKFWFIFLINYSVIITISLIRLIIEKVNLYIENKKQKQKIEFFKNLLEQHKVKYYDSDFI